MSMRGSFQVAHPKRSNSDRNDAKTKAHHTRGTNMWPFDLNPKPHTTESSMKFINQISKEKLPKPACRWEHLILANISLILGVYWGHIGDVFGL